jgi:hypothetical protein
MHRHKEGVKNIPEKPLSEQERRELDDFEAEVCDGIYENG